MRSFYLVMVLLENIVIMVIIDSNAFTEKANEILGERLNGTLSLCPFLPQAPAILMTLGARAPRRP